MTASGINLLGKSLTDSKVVARKQSLWISSELRSTGYGLAQRELRGDQSENYIEAKRKHRECLEKLYRLEKRR